MISTVSMKRNLRQLGQALVLATAMLAGGFSFGGAAVVIVM